MRREIIVLLVFVIVVAAAWWWTNSKPEDSKPKCPNECTYGCITMTSRCREPPCPSNCTLGCIQGTIQCKTESNASNMSNVSVTPKINKITACGVVNESSKLDKDVYSDGTCLTFSNDSITLDCDNHLVIGGNNPDSYGIYIKGRKNVTLQNCIVVNYSTGVMVDLSSEIYIYNTSSIGNTDSGITVNSSRNALLYNAYASENQVGFGIISSSNITLNSSRSDVGLDAVGISIQSSDGIKLFNTQACGSTYYDLRCESSVISASSGNICKANSGCEDIRCSRCLALIPQGNTSGNNTIPESTG